MNSERKAPKYLLLGRTRVEPEQLFYNLNYIMRLTKNIRNLIILVVLLSNVGCDQISKNIARTHIDPDERIVVITSHLILTNVENSGAFLSLGSELPSWVKIPVLIVMPVFVLAWLLIFLLKTSKFNLNQSLSMAFITGGGIGNLYDRILHSSVTDFLYMNFHLFDTGIFNMADVSIMIGTGWLIVDQAILYARSQQTQSTSQD